MTNIIGQWCMKLKNGMEFGFYDDDISDVSPLDRIKGFDQGEYWEIDGGAYSKLFKTYATSQEDDSFVLIPKAEVLDVYFEKYQG